ncbi:hypothetical protein OV079_50935 [Nannocystis pusilla]|uniref:Uncharacterized protein n=1 Tax=Nannocystis pusilla TaxID=889268 RepID=A0A9X3F0U8_9BACT|nr:hypothetical protein [Nannocystis pusilla]MCY1013711.1 hypothetical protein [Nannocystis pusilla]
MLAPRRLALAAALFVACGEPSSVTGEGQPTTGTSTTSPSGQVEPTTGDETSTGSSSTSGPSTTTTSTSGTTTTGTTAVDDTATTGGDSCVDVADCEQSGGDCTKVQCLELECVRVDLEPGSECGLGVCDGKGSCVECNVQADCDPGELCEDHVCHAPDCFDGGKNGLETDIDCGGASCEACEAGQSCEVGDDCQSSSAPTRSAWRRPAATGCGTATRATSTAAGRSVPSARTASTATRATTASRAAARTQVRPELTGRRRCRATRLPPVREVRIAAVLASCPRGRRNPLQETRAAATATKVE